MIDLTIQSDRRKRAIQRARERNIIIPTYKQMKNPAVIPARQSRIEERGAVGREPVEPVPHYVAQ
jgi:hypothetical protein